MSSKEKKKHMKTKKLRPIIIKREEDDEIWFKFIKFQSQFSLIFRYLDFIKLTEDYDIVNRF